MIEFTTSKFSDLNFSTIIEKTKIVASKANDIILNIYQSGDLDITTKPDGSVVGRADLTSHKFLTSALPEIITAPVFSEEDIPNFNIRQNWRQFWLIDPLDHTKGFVRGELDLVRINISFIQEGQPKFALVVNVGTKEFIIGGLKQGVFNQDNIAIESSLNISESLRFACYEPKLELMTARTRGILNQLGATNSNLVYKPTLAGKALTIIKSEAEIYVEPRAIHSWDLAPYLLFTLAQGGSISALDGEKIDFNSESTLLAPLAMSRKGVNLAKILSKLKD